MRITNFIPTKNPLRKRSGHSGFTLVEIVLALGVVSFSLLTVIGTLPVGLETVQEAKVQAAKANISRELRSEFQQISYKTDTGSIPAALAALNSTNYYYSQEGMMVAGSEGSAYYKATFSVGTGTVAAPESTFEYQQNNANNITVTLSYPLSAPEANRKKTIFTLFAAKQKSN